MPGVWLTSVRTRKFKTGFLSVNLLTPLAEETASLNAALPAVLRRGTARYPDMERFSAALDRLYGAQVESVVRKKGEVQCVGFAGSFIDEALAPGQERLLEPVADLMGELLLSPATRNGRFYTEYVDGERSNLADRIRAQMNEKRQYAEKRLIEEMCRGERYSVDRFGSEAAAETVTPQALFAQYNRLLAESQVELFYCGSAEEERLEGALLSALEALPRSESTLPVGTEAAAAPAGDPRVVTEALDVTQGKLSMGFRMGGADEREYPASLLFNTVFGGSTTSKLFMNVREKLSLCYFASSTLHKNKGILTVASGIEFQNYQRAYDEIMAQLKAVQQGQVEDGELEAARRYVVNLMRSTMDSQIRMEDYYLGVAMDELRRGPLELAGLVEKTGLDEVRRVAEKVRLDTVYFLKGLN